MNRILGQVGTEKIILLRKGSTIRVGSREQGKSCMQPSSKFDLKTQEDLHWLNKLSQSSMSLHFFSGQAPKTCFS